MGENDKPNGEKSENRKEFTVRSAIAHDQVSLTALKVRDD